ncbi:hypothetical protein NHF50_05465 [Flavobacterium sp. NRK F10]|uniref:hypothetical protein n=1 Tax=Flavobacterium sp. NRK F10 TaxID=2954931 RepID=UPI0020912A5F|nr:hypothetical protein [Flavobacterium sp. NRK F10]MCO6174486.1 hypothetical protein [Flavobacterium sp. NRK F10]
MSDLSGFRENKISLKNLKLWSENPRFPQAYLGKPENELIDYIVSVPHYKIKAFAKEVVEDFDMPIFEKLAIYDGDGDNVTYEGNRRLTVYKLLLNPELTSDNDVKDYFIQLKRSINIDENFKIDCVISNDKKEILRYVNRKHLNNNNEVAWGSLENSNAKIRWLDNPGKVDIFRSNLSVIIRNLDIPSDDKDKILGKGFVTTLFRILNTTTTAKFFKLTFDNDNNLLSDDDNFISKLKIIINDILLKKTFNGKIFSRLETNDIDAYLKSITLNINEETLPKVNNLTDSNPIKVSNNNSTVDLKKEEDKTDDKSKGVTKKISTVNNSSIGSSGAIIPVKKPKVKAKSTLRKHLIPKDCKLTIEEVKINNIYRELRDDLIIDDSSKSVPNAVGVLFRVFIEVCLDHYAEKKTDMFLKKKMV